LLATGSPNAESTFDKVLPYIDEHASQWQAVRTEICINNKVEKTWDTDTTAKATWCLVQRQIALEELINLVLASDPDSINRTIDAASRLSKPLPCADPFYLHTTPPPPENPDAIRPVMQQVMRANAVRSSGNYPEAKRLATAAKASADSLDWAPLVAQASWTLGMSLMELGKHAQAEEAFEAAYFQAAPIGAHELATAAAISLIEVVGLRLARHDDGMRWWKLTEVSMVHLDPNSKRIRRGYALDVVAGIYYQKGLYEQSKASLVESLALRREAVGEEHPSYSNGLNNLALVHLALANHKKAVELAQQTLDLKQKIHGKNHPSVANALATVGSFFVFEGEFTQAKEHLQQALKMQQDSIGTDSPRLIAPLKHLALVLHALGEEEQALAHLQQALAISREAFGPNHIRETEIQESLALIAVDLKDYTQAQTRLEQILALRTKALEPEDPSIAETRNSLGSLLLQTGFPEQAHEHFSAALAIWKDVLGPEHPRLAQAWIGLANVALAQGQPARAVKLARQAMERRESSHARPIELAAAKWQLAQALWAQQPNEGRDEVLALLGEAKHLYRRVGGKHTPLIEINNLIKQVSR
ncbi:MAG: tetratricopeptide repeat protein, partial [Nannocystaceae bacterium]